MKNIGIAFQTMPILITGLVILTYQTKSDDPSSTSNSPFMIVFS